MWGDVGRCRGDVGGVEHVRDHLRLRLALEHAAHHDEQLALDARGRLEQLLASALPQLARLG